MKSYYRILLGRGHAHAPQSFERGFIGVDFGFDEDLTGKLPENWKEFNRAYIPVFLAKHPDKSKIAAGLACGAVWTVSKGMSKGDIILSPDGSGSYHVGEVIGDYVYAGGQPLPHRRPVSWLAVEVPRAAMSDALRHSTGGPGPVSNISAHNVEIEQLLGTTPPPPPPPSPTDPDIVDPVAFALEKHLEDFLVANWSQTTLSRDFDIYEDDGELVGQQYATEAGPIDILAVSKDRKRLLVIELKRGRASDRVVGQVLRYMGFVKDQIAEAGQEVEGVVIALEDDPQLRWALVATPSVSFYRYEVSFRLVGP